MKSQASIEIQCPIDEVFRLTNEHVAEWSLTVISDELVEQTVDGIGTRFRTVTEGHGQRKEFDGVVTAYDPPFRNRIYLTGKSFNLDIDYQFQVTGDGTRVTQIVDVQPKRILKVLFGLFGWLMQKASCEEAMKELESLRAFCESRPLNS